MFLPQCFFYFIFSHIQNNPAILLEAKHLYVLI